MIKRHIQQDILDSLKHFPVVLLTGARQVGKSTQVQGLSLPGWGARYLTLDNRVVLDAALTVLSVGLQRRRYIDEVQRAPDMDYHAGEKEK